MPNGQVGLLFQNGGTELRFKRYTTEQSTDPSIQLSSLAPNYPQLVTFKSELIAAYVGTASKLAFRISTDNGVTWEAESFPFGAATFASDVGFAPIVVTSRDGQSLYVFTAAGGAVPQYRVSTDATLVSWTAAAAAGDASMRVASANNCGNAGAECYRAHDFELMETAVPGRWLYIAKSDSGYGQSGRGTQYGTLGGAWSSQIDLGGSGGLSGGGQSRATTFLDRAGAIIYLRATESGDNIYLQRSVDNGASWGPQVNAYAPAQSSYLTGSPVGLYVKSYSQGEYVWWAGFGGTEDTVRVDGLWSNPLAYPDSGTARLFGSNGGDWDAGLAYADTFGQTRPGASTGSGVYTTSATDLALPGRLLPLSFTRTYTSADRIPGPLGLGWTHSYNWALTENGDRVQVRRGDGRRDAFTRNQDGSYLSPVGVFDVLTKNANGSYTLTTPSQVQYEFVGPAQTSQYATAVAADAPAAYWRLNESTGTSAADAGPNALAGTYSNVALAMPGALHDPTTSVAFNGTTSKITAGVTGVPSGASARTVEAWINPTGNGGTILAANTSSGQRFIVDTFQAGGTWYLFTDSVNSSNNVTLAGAEVPPTGVWSHVAFVFDGAANTWHYYLNGVATKNGTFGTAINTAALTSTTIGERLDVSQPFSGRLDEVAVYPSALSANQIATHYRAVLQTGGLLSRIHEPAGNQLTLTYGGRDLTQITDTVGRVATLSYDASHHLTALQDSSGRKVTYAYDASARLVSSVDKLGNTAGQQPSQHTWTYGYDGSTIHIATITDPDGRVTVTNTYDSSGRLATQAPQQVTFTPQTTDFAVSKTVACDSTYSSFACSNANDGSDASTWFANTTGGTASQYIRVDLGATYTIGAFRAFYGYDGANNRVNSYRIAVGPTATFSDATVVYVAPNANNANDGATHSVSTPVAGRYVWWMNGGTCDGVTVGALCGASNPGMSSFSVYAPAIASVAVSRFGYAAGTTTITDPRGHQTTVTFDPRQRPLSVADVVGTHSYTIQYGYDDAGNRTSTIDRDGNRTDWSYDARGNLLTKTEPQLNPQTPRAVTSLTYDSKNNLLTATDARAFVTTNTYDQTTNRLLSSSSQIDGLTSATTKYEYGDSLNPGLPTKIISPRGNTTGTPNYTYSQALSYDSSGNLIQRVDADGAKTTYAYDTVGRRTSMVDPDGYATGELTTNHTWITAYDPDDRVTSESDALNQTTSYGVSAAGNRLSVTDKNGEATGYAYDAAGRLSSVTQKPDPVGQPTLIYTTAITRDDNGNATHVTQANGVVTDYSYDALDRQLTTVTHPTAGTSLTTSYVLNGSGQPTTRTTGDGVAITYAYDNDARLTSVAATGLTTISYGYDAANHRTSMVDATGTTTYSYDGLGRLSQAAQPNGTTTYGYDLDSNRTTLGYPTVGTVTYSYSAGGRLSGLTDWASHTAAYTYTSSGQAATVTVPGGLVTTYTYDYAQRLSQVQSAVGSTTITNHIYTLDAEGNRTALDEFVSGITTGTTDHFGYTYDGLERLTAGTTTNPESFSLDAASNIASRTGPSATNSYDTSNRQTSDGTNTLTWNAADRLTGRGSDSFSYDPLDRMTASTVSSTARTYAYNGDGLLQSRTQGTATTFLWDPSSSPSRLLQQGTDRIVYGLGPLWVVKADASTSSFARDGGKSVRAEVNGSGAVTASFRYRAYGAIAQSSGASAPSYLGYAGQLVDPSGVLYMRARWYDPASGRFLTKDPISGDAAKPLTVNGYPYAGANPIVASDPSGNAFARDGVDCASGPDQRCLGVWLPAAPQTARTPRFSLQGMQGSGSLSLLGAQGSSSWAVIPSGSGDGGATFTWGGGGTSALGGANLAAGPVIANARTVTDYKGPFKDVGFSCSAGLGVSLDVASGQASDGASIWVVTPQAVVGARGITVLGFVPLPCEVHVLATQTETAAWR